VRLLLDTHTLLWTLSAPDILSPEAHHAIAAEDNVLYVSIGTLWECAIKAGLGKLHLPDDFFRALEAAGFEILNIGISHLEVYRTLPLYHRDPFDRILVAQAISERLTLITRDQVLSQYDVPIVQS